MDLPIHDTHVHLDLLLQFLGIIPDIRDLQNQPEIILKPQLQANCQTQIDYHLQNHKLVIQSTVSTKNFELLQKLLPQNQNPKLKLLLGAHPEIVDDKFDLNSFLQYQTELVNKYEADKYPFVGIGETGLDYHYTQEKTLINKQKQLFESQINLAIDTDTALVIHCREAFTDLLEILKTRSEIHGRFLIHCFTGDTEILKQILDLGGVVAYGGIITFGSSADTLRDSFRYCPNENFVLETDLPYLTPTPHRGQTNLPEYINLIAQKASEIKQQTLENIWQNSYKNSIQLFGLQSQ